MEKIDRERDREIDREKGKKKRKEKKSFVLLLNPTILLNLSYQIILPLSSIAFAFIYISIYTKARNI